MEETDFFGIIEFFLKKIKQIREPKSKQGQVLDWLIKDNLISHFIDAEASSKQRQNILKVKHLVPPLGV